MTIVPCPASSITGSRAAFRARGDQRLTSKSVRAVSESATRACAPVILAPALLITISTVPPNSASACAASAAEAPGFDRSVATTDGPTIDRRPRPRRRPRPAAPAFVQRAPTRRPCRPAPPPMRDRFRWMRRSAERACHRDPTVVFSHHPPCRLIDNQSSNGQIVHIQRNIAIGAVMVPACTSSQSWRFPTPSRSTWRHRSRRSAGSGCPLAHRDIASWCADRNRKSRPARSASSPTTASRRSPRRTPS